MTTDPALIERMEKLVRIIADSIPRSSGQDKQFAEARAITALLPDKDTEAARCIVINIMAKSGYGKTAQEHVAVGDDDGNEMVLAALAGIKHGRVNP